MHYFAIFILGGMFGVAVMVTPVEEQRNLGRIEVADGSWSCKEWLAGELK